MPGYFDAGTVSVRSEFRVGDVPMAGKLVRSREPVPTRTYADFYADSDTYTYDGRALRNADTYACSELCEQ